MKKAFILMICLLIWRLLLPQPILEFETLKLDIGRIKEEEGPHEIIFNYSNKGDEPFRLIDINAG